MALQGGQQRRDSDQSAQQEHVQCRKNVLPDATVRTFSNGVFGIVVRPKLTELQPKTCF